MFSPVRTCPRCNGRGFRQLLGMFRIDCRRCGGTGHVFKLSARLWSLLRHGASEEY